LIIPFFAHTYFFLNEIITDYFFNQKFRCNNTACYQK